MKGMRKRNGFTLIEMMMGVLLAAILIGTAGVVYSVILRQWLSTQIRTHLRQDGVYALERLSRELNEAREITSSQASSIQFWWQDTDADGVRDSGELVQFSWAGAAGDPLARDSVFLAHNVKTFQISYRDLNNAALSPNPDLSLAVRDSIRRVDVDLTLSEEDEEVRLFTAITPRNLRQARGPW